MGVWLLGFSPNVDHFLQRKSLSFHSKVKRLHISLSSSFPMDVHSRLIQVIYLDARVITDILIEDNFAPFIPTRWCTWLLYYSGVKLSTMSSLVSSWIRPIHLLLKQRFAIDIKLHSVHFLLKKDHIIYQFHNGSQFFIDP